MTLGLRILADDLTGALDSSAAFAGTGAVPVWFEPPQRSEAPIMVAVSATRDVSTASLPDRLSRWLPWFADGAHAFKKVDSLVRGNTMAEVAWLARSGAFERVVFAPAFPAQGRLTHRGVHDLAGAGRIDLRDAFAREGVDVCIGAADHAATEAQVFLPDIAGDADLAALAARFFDSSARRWLWCGSAGLSWQIAREAGVAPRAPCWPPVDPPVLIATASRHPVLRGQLAALADAGVRPMQSVPTTLPHAIALVDLAPAANLDADAAAAVLAKQAQLLTAAVRPNLLVAIGGDTLLALCAAAGVQSLASGAVPGSGWGCARLIGGRWDGVLCLSRSGAFGGSDDLVALLDSINLHWKSA